MTALFAASLPASAATVAHYRFESGPDGGAVTTVDDSGPKALAGTVTGNLTYAADVAPDDTAGSFALDARGDGNYGTVAHNAAFNLQGDLTIELFFRADAPYDAYESLSEFTLVVKRHTDVPGNFMGSWLLGSQSSTGRVFCEIGFGGESGVKLTATADLRDGQWHHAALVLNRDISGSTDELRLYVDGVLESSQQGTWGALANGTSPLVLGAGNFAAGFNRNFDGFIDEVRISDAALSPMDQLVAVPEPSVWGAALAATLGGLALVGGRRVRTWRPPGTRR